MEKEPTPFTSEWPGGDEQTKKEEPAQKGAEQKQNLPELRERLRLIIQTLSGRPDLTVTTDVNPQMLLQMAAEGKDARETWYRETKHDPETKKVISEVVHIPEQIVEANENIAKGKAAHEAGHVAITRYGEFVPDKVLQEPGFHGMLAALEERPTDQVVRERFAGAGTWVDEARKGDVREGLNIAREKQGQGITLPKSLQLCDLMVHAPHFEEIPPELYDAEVTELYNKIKAHVERAEQTLPREGATEAEIVKRAKERYKLAYAKIWPEVKKLVAEDVKNEELQQMVQDALSRQQEGEAGEKHKEGAGAGKNPFDKLPEELKRELEEAIKKITEAIRQKREKEKAEGEKKGGAREGEKKGEKAEEGGGGEKEKQEDTEKGEEGTQGQKETKGDEGEEKESAPQETPKGESAAKEGEPDESREGEEEGGVPVPMNALSKKLIEALKKLFDSLPEEKRKELSEKANKAFQDMEDELVEKLSGKLEDVPAETHKEHRERKDKEKHAEREGEERKAEQKTIAKELKDIERKQAALAENKDAYEKTYAEVHALDEELCRRLEEIFTPNIKRDMKLKSSGAHLNLPAVFRWESERGAGLKSIDNRIFESVHLPEKKDYVFTVLVDLSGSMGNSGKIEETFKAVVLLAEVLNRLGVRNEILGFQDIVLNFKNFDEELTDDIRRKVSGMVSEVYGNNPGGHNAADWNDDGPCLREASEGLEGQPGREKFLLVLSDGKPEGHRSTSEDLTEAIRHILANTGQKLVALGLGKNTEHVKEFYPASLPNIDVKKLPEVLGGLLEDILRNPEAYAYAVRP